MRRPSPKATDYLPWNVHPNAWKKLFLGKLQIGRYSGLEGFERVSHGDKSGDIILDRQIRRGGKGTYTTETGFLALADFAAAERALTQMLEAYKARWAARH